MKRVTVKSGISFLKTYVFLFFLNKSLYSKNMKLYENCIKVCNQNRKEVKISKLHCCSFGKLLCLDF